MRFVQKLTVLLIFIMSFYTLMARTVKKDNSVKKSNINLITNNPGDPVYIDYKVRTDDYYAQTKEGNIFQGNADPVWQVKGQLGTSINEQSWTEWVSIADAPGSQAYKNGAWYNRSLTECWSGKSLSNADNVYIRIQGYENEDSNVHSYSSTNDSYYSTDTDVHTNLSDTVTRNQWKNYINSESGNGDYVDCGSGSNYNYYKVEFDVWWNYSLPVNPQFSIINPTTDGFSINLTDLNNYRVTEWGYQLSWDPSFNNIAFADDFLTSDTEIIHGLSNNTTYYVRIRGSNEAGTGAFTSGMSFQTAPLHATHIFPMDSTSDMPKLVTVNWRYHGEGNPLGFKVFQNNIQVGNDIDWNGNNLYSQRLNNGNWGETIDWSIVPYNESGVCDTPVTSSFTIMNEPENSHDVPASVVYTEINDYTGTNPDPITLPSIDLGEGDVNPSIDLSFDESVFDFTSEIRVLDQPINPLPQSSNCATAILVDLPVYVSSTLTLNYNGSTIPSELVHWNGSYWEDVTVSAGAVFNIGMVTFTWTSTGRGIEEFAVNNGEASTLPIILSSFTAAAIQSDYVQIDWITQSEANLLGFDVYRNSTSEVRDAIKLNGELINANNSLIEKHYSYTDSEIEKECTYYYWLSTHEFDGTLSYHGPIEVKIADDDNEELPEIELSTKVIGNYPNPFNPTTNIQFSICEESNVIAKIYNSKGQLILDYGINKYAEGKHSIFWDGRDSNKRAVASGIYFVNIKIGKTSFIHKMTMIK